MSLHSFFFLLYFFLLIKGLKIIGRKSREKHTQAVKRRKSKLPEVPFPGGNSF